MSSFLSSIGCNFDLRWSLSRRIKARRMSKTVMKENTVDGLEDSLRKMSIKATDVILPDVDIAQANKRKRAYVKRFSTCR